MRQILLFTDFGCSGPYTGQMESVIKQIAPQTAVIQLLSNAPESNPRLSAYLLAALRADFPEDSIFLTVIDPGVGSERKALVLKADGQYFVGPDNGLLSVVAAQARQVQWWQITWQPENCSSSFHGRDIFAPIAARLSINEAKDYLTSIEQPDEVSYSADLAQIIYFDHYGNAMTGLRYDAAYRDQLLQVNNAVIHPARTFSDVRQGEVFWYKNSSGLVEIAVNQASAQQQLRLSLGDPVCFK